MASSAENWTQPGIHKYCGMQLGIYTNGDTLNDVSEYEDFKEGDCMVVSYPKTGTTMTQEIVYLVYNNGDVEKAKLQKLVERVPFMEFSPSAEYGDTNNGLELIKNMEHPKLIKSHLLFENFSYRAQEILKFVYVVRNPKDVLVSYYHFYRSHGIFGKFPGDFSGFMKLFYNNRLDYGNYFDHIKNWMSAMKKGTSKILLVKYEDLLNNKFGEVKRIAKFCEKELSDETIQRIVQHTSFTVMKDNPSVNNRPENGDDQMSSMSSALSPFLIRKGQIGDWKNHFTHRDSEEMDIYIENHMKDIDITFQYE